jgi:hypothetical protein
VEEAARGRIDVGFLERLAKLETKEYLVEEAPRETLNRVEAYMLRSGYWMVTGARTDVQASFSRTRGLLDLLSPFDGFFIKAVVSRGGEGQTQLTLWSNNNAREDAERMAREACNARRIRDQKG